MRIVVSVFAATMLLLCGAGPIYADVTCGAGAGVVTLTSANSIACIDTTSSAGLYTWGVDGVDQMFQEWFWYRLGSTGPESAINTLSAPTVTLPASNLATIQYGNATFSVSVAFNLTGGQTGSGASDIAETIRINNLSGSPLDFHFFEYTDFDLNNSIGGQTVTFTNANTVDQSGGGNFLTETVATGAGGPPSHHEAALFADTLNSLNDGLPTTLNDVTSAGPGDATWAFQWDRTIDAGGSLIISKDKNIATVVPEPASILGLGTVLFFIGSKLRRKKA